MIVAHQTQLTLTKALTGGFYIKDSYRVALQYGGFVLIAIAALLTILGSVATADAGAVSLLRTITLVLALAVLAFGGFVLYAYKHGEALQNQTTQAMPNHVSATTDTSGTSTGVQIHCVVDTSGSTTSKCSYNDGSPAPAPGQDPLTAHCTDQGLAADRPDEIYTCSP